MQNLLMRLFALNLAFYQSGIEIIHGLNLTRAITSKSKILTSFNSLKSSTIRVF